MGIFENVLFRSELDLEEDIRSLLMTQCRRTTRLTVMIVQLFFSCISGAAVREGLQVKECSSFSPSNCRAANSFGSGFPCLFSPSRMSPYHSMSDVLLARNNELSTAAPTDGGHFRR